MSEVLLLGIDLGTGGCKITIINSSGGILAEASSEYKTCQPEPSFSEQNPADWFSAVIKCFSIIRDHGNIDLKKIGAVALDGSTHNAVLLDRYMEVIRPTIMWTDQRSIAEVSFLEKGWGEEIFRISYQKVAPTWTLPQLLWIRNHEPANYKRIHRLMFVKDYVRFLLTGSWETDYIDAQGTMFFDFAERRWSEELCRLIDLPMEVLPPVRLPTDITGKITERASKLTGLTEGTPVICGTSDSCIEDYGSGAIRPGQCILKLATAGNVNIMTAQPNPTPRTLTYSHVVPGLWYTVSATNTAASAMRWFRDNFCSEEMEKSAQTGRNVYQIMEDLIKPVPPGSEGLIFHPYLLGERAPYWDPYLRASFIGASMAHKKGHFLRALMEGVAFSLKDCFRLIESMNLEVSEFIIIGGGAKSEIWSQIICDVFGKKVQKPLVTDASYGSALLAGVGAGVFSDVADAAQKCIRVDKTYQPEINNYKKYNEIFNLYLKVHNSLEDIYKDLNKVIS
jgi:xylulokinase